MVNGGTELAASLALLLGQNTLVENCSAEVDIDSKADVYRRLSRGIYSSSSRSNQDTTLIKNCSWTGAINCDNRHRA